MNKNASIQDTILNTVRKDRIPVTVHLTNGLPLKGFVRAFDTFVVLVEGEGSKQMMIYKHAISTITPSRSVQYNQTEEAGGAE